MTTRTPGHGPGGRRNMRLPGQKLEKGVIKRLISYLKPYKFRLLLVVLCIVISAVASVKGSTFVGSVIDDYVTPLLQSLQAGGRADYSSLLRAVLKMAGIYLVGIGATLCFNLIMITVAQSVLKTIRDAMFTHMQTLPLRYFDTHAHGDIMSHYTNDTDTLRQMISQSIPQTLSSAITIVSVFCAMLSTSVYLTLFVLLTVVVMMALAGKMATKSGKYFVQQQDSLGKVNGYIEEMINGQKVIKVFCHERTAEQDFDKLNNELCENMTNANRIANIMMPIMGNLGHLQYVLIAALGAMLAITGLGNIPGVHFGGLSGLTLGNIAAFLLLSKNFTMPINQVTQQVNSIVMALAGAGRIFKLLDEKSEDDEGYVTLVNAKEQNGELAETPERTGLWAWRHPHGDGSVTYQRLTGQVELENVTFGYNPEKTVLHNISLYAKPGQKVAFVGATGAGKTTITNLINRFYNIESGKIRYDGININKIKKEDLRRSLGVVLQDVNLFTGTVMDNIRYGRLNATDEECIAAARLANADGFINMLKDGYQTVLTGDGSGLSQGQRQLISIARAAVADPPVMILDEATSSIDTRTEALVQRGMDGLMKGRTVFVIAHRLSTVQNADVIMVLDH